MASSKKTPRKSGGNRKTTAKKPVQRTKNDYIIKREIEVFAAIAVCFFLFLCNFGIIGTIGNYMSEIMFGIFGFAAYVTPLLVGLVIVLFIIRSDDLYILKKTIISTCMFVFVTMFIDMVSGIAKKLDAYSASEIYQYGAQTRKGGGFLSASINYLLVKGIDKVGTFIIIICLIIACAIVLSEKSFITIIKTLADNYREKSEEDRIFKDEVNADKEQERQARKAAREEKEEQRKLKNEESRQNKELLKQQKEDEKVLRKDKKAVGVTSATDLMADPKANNTDRNNDVHEIILNGFDPTLDDMITEGAGAGAAETAAEAVAANIPPKSEEIIFDTDDTDNNSYEEPEVTDLYNGSESSDDMSEIIIIDEPVDNNVPVTQNKPVARPVVKNDLNAVQAQGHGVYKFPPLDLLKKSSGAAKGDSAQEIRDTAKKLKDTLAIFGVEAEVTDTCQGPTVTRFELQPKLGTKVSRIKNLTDDIKLNLAASDIRIEAPIPGKAAIGIEVPNKINQAVLFRDLIDNNDFKSFGSDLAFAVGKDISGRNIIYDIDKFPHLLIAGATGSGKSVCINTLIMSIIYKANPDDVKLIMIDPKVVELSVYNGIPHLLLPVVTDAKKAAATLNYAVTEMMERYRKFADMNTRDLAGYNREVVARGESEVYKKLPQIIIIVDELADLIMVAKNDVEDAICRLAQLARAAGIHLIIATQRPSVDVITGLIKANMPSRIAFAVSSNTDSRTILDMGGAEELLGRGDMLFFPKGLKKPVRLQGGYVDDQEVNAVVDFLKQNCAPANASDMAELDQKISSMSSSSGGGGSASGDVESGFDDMFIEAGRFIIESNKASIGMLQRKFKMGFNRAARVMDQLAEAGVVGPDEGTKPRQILMGLDQFENYIENEM